MPPPKVWLGFYDDNLPESATITTLHMATTPADAVHAYSLGQRSVLRTQSAFLNHSSLWDDWLSRWDILAGEAGPLLENGTIIGFFLGDELVWNCLPLETFETMASAIHDRFPNAVTWANEATPVITLGLNRCKEFVDYRIGGPVTWVSVDQYHWSGADPQFVHEIMRVLYEDFIFPYLDDSHFAVFVPGAFGSRANPQCDIECYSSMCQLDAEEFVEWAINDERIAAVVPWHWNPAPRAIVTWDEIGVSDMPDLRETWAKMGQLMRGQ